MKFHFARLRDCHYMIHINSFGGKMP